ncbi:uncharacterized protein LOC134177497 [Corticium candelabrum]|uniref:uncharacterized protein LOC134177497 n=1 Tax=Corticium candelabrum TaxID=121492 RepID=UPI002E25F4D9|nr:uncharacterized protein LOC134177497 [Corticium candelabrum]
MAVCDAHYRFPLSTSGNSGRHSDGGVLSNSEFGKALEAGNLGMPSPTSLPGTGIEVPFVFVGDEAFSLQRNILRQCPGINLADSKAIFNYRLSHARRIIENSFGILTARWLIFRRPIIASPDNVDIFIQAAIAQHNYLRTTQSTVCCSRGFSDAEDAAGNIIEGTWRSEVAGDNGLNGVCSLGSNMHSRSAAPVRNTFETILCPLNER